MGTREGINTGDEQWDLAHDMMRRVCEPDAHLAPFASPHQLVGTAVRSAPPKQNPEEPEEIWCYELNPTSSMTEISAGIQQAKNENSGCIIIAGEELAQAAKMVLELAEQQDLEDKIIAQKMQLSQLEHLIDDDTPFADVADGIESLLAESVSH